MAKLHPLAHAIVAFQSVQAIAVHGAAVAGSINVLASSVDAVVGSAGDFSETLGDVLARASDVICLAS